MATKNKKIKISPAVARGILGSLIIIAILGFFSLKVIDFIEHSSYFKVKEIWYESSLKFMESDEIRGLKGKNIFDINLAHIEKELQLKYPQCAQLRVLKRLPNQILVTAKQRVPFAQVSIGNQLITLDEKGVVLSIGGDFNHQLAMITGIHSLKGRIANGALLDQPNLQVALRIIKTFYSDKVLSFFRMTKVDVSNLSEIFLFVGDNFKVIMDQENIPRKLKILSLVLSQTQLGPDIKYIDLRFKEPILGKK